MLFQCFLSGSSLHSFSAECRVKVTILYHRYDDVGGSVYRRSLTEVLDLEVKDIMYKSPFIWFSFVL